MMVRSGLTLWSRSTASVPRRDSRHLKALLAQALGQILIKAVLIIQDEDQRLAHDQFLYGRIDSVTGKLREQAMFGQPPVGGGLWPRWLTRPGIP